MNQRFISRREKGNIHFRMKGGNQVMRKGLRKNYQKKFNKKMRQLNSSIVNDPLWQGRFVFLQKDSQFETFADRSGGMMYVTIRAFDKKTGYYRDYSLEYAPWLKSIDWKLGMEIANTFITEDLAVWTKEKVRDNIQDFRNTKVDVSKLMAEDNNFYVNEENFDVVGYNRVIC